MRGFNYKKAIQALNYFALQNGGQINKMKALKLIWLSDRYHLRKFGRTITGDVYFALPFGPVASTTRDILEKNEGLSDIEIEYSVIYLQPVDKYNYMSISSFVEKVLSETDKKALETVYSTYKDHDHFMLSELSHNFPEWEKYKSALDRNIASRFEIDWNDFFQNVDDGKGLFIDTDEFLAISRELFQQKTQVRW